LGYQKESCAIEHALFAERQGFDLAEVHQILEYLGHMEDGAGSHSLRVFLESVFPIAGGKKIAVRQVCNQLVDIFPIDDLAKSDVAGVGGRNHDEDVVGANSQKIESFEFTRYKTIGDFFNYSNSVVGIDDLITDFKWIHSEVNDFGIVRVGSSERQASIAFQEIVYASIHDFEPQGADRSRVRCR